MVTSSRGPEDKIWDLVGLVWQFEVWWLQFFQLWLSAGISSVAPMFVPRDRDLCHIPLHPTWLEPTAECRSYCLIRKFYDNNISLSQAILRNKKAVVKIGDQSYLFCCYQAENHFEASMCRFVNLKLLNACQFPQFSRVQHPISVMKQLPYYFCTAGIIGIILPGTTVL